jgi:CheY-like chemotaxis protein
MKQPATDRFGTGVSAPKLIYVVDDEPMLLELATVVLEPLGYRVETFRNAESAFAAYQAAAQPPALILTDYAMHLMTGLQLIEACRRMRPGQKAVLVSGTVDERVYSQGSCIPDGFLAKPYLARQLVEWVESLLKSQP